MRSYSLFGIKRIARLLMIGVSSISLVSCSNGFETKAKQQMEQTMKELAKDPSSLQISNVETIFSNDSICILHFKSSGKNGFGGVSSSKMEYIYLTWTKGNGELATYETVIKLDDKPSILKTARKDYQDKSLEPEYVKEMSEDDRKAWHIHFAASLYMIGAGREVNSDNNNNIDNW